MTKIYYSIAKRDDYTILDIIKKFKNKNRNTVHNLSRLCLVNLFNSITNESLKITDPLIENYQYDQLINNYQASISHTNDCAAVALCHSQNFKSVGIDLEFKDRSIENDSQRFFINEQDKFQTQNLLEKWCIKEACFKALAKINPNVKLLKDVIIEDNFFYDKENSHEKNNQYYKMVKDQELIVIISWITNQENKEIKIEKIS